MDTANPMEMKGLVVFPENLESEERSFRDMEAVCRKIAEELPPEKSATLREFYTLLRRRQDRHLLVAYNSGIQVDRRRAEKEGL